MQLVFVLARALAVVVGVGACSTLTSQTQVKEPDSTGGRFPLAVDLDVLRSHEGLKISKLVVQEDTVSLGDGVPRDKTAGTYVATLTKSTAGEFPRLHYFACCRVIREGVEGYLSTPVYFAREAP